MQVHEHNILFELKMFFWLDRFEARAHCEFPAELSAKRRQRRPGSNVSRHASTFRRFTR